MEKLNVLISLHRGYGLGDGVQMSSVLQHVVKFRPQWNIHYQAEEGRYCIGNGIVNKTFEFSKGPADFRYDAEVEILLYDTWANWHDRPNTRVSSCLRDRFGLDWDAECGRYVVNISEGARIRAAYFVQERDNVAIHYRGDSSPNKKDLTHKQASAVCDHVVEMGYVPLLLDWRDMSPLSNRGDVMTTGKMGERSRSIEWGRSAEMNCAVISECVAFVGIDSGPSKCASATDTTALVVWTGHHPAPFHDPAPNTTHLVPRGYHGLEPVVNDRGVIDWFEANYSVRQYDSDPVSEIKAWLTETLTETLK